MNSHDVRLYVCLEWACIVIIWCSLVYSWIVRCSGQPDSKACPPTPKHLFLVPPGRGGNVGYG